MLVLRQAGIVVLSFYQLWWVISVVPFVQGIVMHENSSMSFPCSDKQDHTVFWQFHYVSTPCCSCDIWPLQVWFLRSLSLSPLTSHLSPLASCLDLPSLPSLPPWSFPTHTFVTMLGSLTIRSPQVVCQKHKNFLTPKPLPHQLAPCLLMALSTSVQGLPCISIRCSMQEISVSVECFLSTVNNQTSPGLWSLQHRLQGI